MKQYPCGRIERLAKALTAEHVDPAVRAHILEGGEIIAEDPRAESQARWFAESMRRLESSLDPRTARAVRERCACCLRGKRLELSRGIARDHETLEARIAAANEAKLVFGSNVWLTGDGRVRVAFWPPEAQGPFRCPCLRNVPEPLPIIYCYCCGGHVKHHLQKALGRQLEVTVCRSVLASGGEESCEFEFAFVE